MKRAAIFIAIFAVLGFVGGVLYARVTTQVVPKFKAQRVELKPRLVSAQWHADRFSPGHSQHVLNQVIECDECHDPAQPDFSGVDTGVCTACHEEQASHPHTGSGGEVTDCFSCHAFKFDSSANGPWDCGRCHGPFDTATHAGLAMHDSISCAHCHDPHKPVAETVEACTDCHKGLNVRHGRPAVSGSCADCHGGHKLASEAAACMHCHQTEEPRVPATATFGGGHETCSSCHQPHAFSARSAERCESCHKRQPVLAERTVRQHRDCRSCHEPHAVRDAGDQSCKGCHRDVVSTHPVENRRDCTSCHDPHPKQTSQVALLCSHCHQEATTERAFHSQKTLCADCHKPHGFDLSSVEERAFCARCHAPQIRLTKRIPGHSSCESCHRGTPHALEGPIACASCHEKIVAGSPSGHQDCASCHEPHGGAVAAATTCASCHDSKNLPGLHRIPDDPKGTGHSECAACHNVHSSTVRADRAACAQCHDNLATHEPDAKRCTGCHTFIRAR
ncbi:MAG: hypothetical protein WCE62_06760 [Polyangiales bacterium]